MSGGTIRHGAVPAVTSCSPGTILPLEVWKAEVAAHLPWVVTPGKRFS